MSYTNELGAEQQHETNMMYERIDQRLRRDSPMEGEGRRTPCPPDPIATTETNLHKNMIVKRGVDLDITSSAVKNSSHKLALRNTLKPSATSAGSVRERTASSTVI
jgi:hypothetical protein